VSGESEVFSLSSLLHPDNVSSAHAFDSVNDLIDDSFLGSTQFHHAAVPQPRHSHGIVHQPMAAYEIALYLNLHKAAYPAAVILNQTVLTRTAPLAHLVAVRVLYCLDFCLVHIFSV
jgi:hypothetical protein